MTGAARAALLSLLGLLAGCGLLPAREGTAPAAAAGPPAARLEVQAPAPLKALLEQQLDVARLAALPADDGLDETEWRRLVAAAPLQARELLQTEGYFDADVQVQRDAGPPATVTVTVQPGERTRIAGFELAFEGALAQRAAAGDEAARTLSEGLRSGWTLPPPAWFRNAAWSEAKAALLARLRAAGYASAAYSRTRAEVDADSRSARLSLVVDSGPLYLAGPIVVEGLVAHDEATVRHLAGFGPGTPLTETLLLDYQERLQKANLFDSAAVGFDPVPGEAAATPVRVRLHETRLQQATLGVGISANTGPRLSLEHTHRRPFGSALIAHDKLEWGRDRQLIDGELATHPGEGFRRWLVGVQAERVITDSDVVASQRLRVGRAEDRPTLERLVFLEFDRALQTSDTLRRDAQAVSAQVQLVARRLDSVLLPTRGATLSLQAAVGQARSVEAASGPFLRLYGRLTGYWPFGGWFGNARLELGHIVKRDDVDVPDSLAFRAGGDESVRGYAYRSLAPSINGTTVGGSVLFTGSVELARPISERFPSVWGAAFIDAGRAAERWRDLRPALGYGLGVRWRSPVGPLKIDYAWGREEQRGRLHLSVGIAY